MSTRIERAVLLLAALAVVLPERAAAVITVSSSVASLSTKVIDFGAVPNGLVFDQDDTGNVQNVVDFTQSISSHVQNRGPQTATASQDTHVQSTPDSLGVTSTCSYDIEHSAPDDTDRTNLRSEAHCGYQVSFCIDGPASFSASLTGDTQGPTGTFRVEGQKGEFFFSEGGEGGELPDASGGAVSLTVGIALEDDQGHPVPTSGSQASQGELPAGCYSALLNASGTFTSPLPFDRPHNPPSLRGSARLALEVGPTGPQGHVFQWVGPAQGTFGDQGNWKDESGNAGVPSFVDFENADTAVVQGEGDLTLDLGAGAASRALEPRAAERKTGRLEVLSTRTLEPVGGTLILDSLAPELGNRSFEIGGAQVLLDQGGVQARHVSVGQGGDAELDVVGPTGFFTTLGRFGIGGDHEGDVVIQKGATVTSAETVLGEAGGQGSATAQDEGTLWQTANLAVGFAHDASLDVEGGARVESDDAFVDCGSGACIGLSGDERARVVVRGKAAGGTPSTWALAGDLHIGPRGLVSIEDGGQIVGSGLALPNVAIGDSGNDTDCLDGLACLDVRDGSVSAAGIDVGAGGVGTLQVEAAGRVSALVGAVVGHALTRGVVEITGPSAESQLVAAGLSVGDELGGQGALRLESGAQATVTGAVDVGTAGPGASGLIELQGDSSAPDATVLHVSGGDVTLGADASDAEAALFEPTGEIALENARVELQDQSLAIRRLGRVSGTGRIDGLGVVTVQNDGEIGCNVLVNAAYVQGPTGVLECQQSAPLPVTSPQLNPLLATRFARAVRAKPVPPPPTGPFVVQGDATLDGTLVLQFQNGAAPRQGDAFALLDVSGSVTGAFANVAVRGLTTGIEGFAQDLAGGKLVLTSTSDATALPTVSVKAKPTLKESAKKGAKVKFTRSGDTSQPLVVHYAVGGTATSLLDYGALPGTLEIPARKKSATLAVVPLPDSLAEGPETVEIQVLPGDDYTPSLASRATIVILNVEPKLKKPKG